MIWVTDKAIIGTIILDQEEQEERQHIVPVPKTHIRTWLRCHIRKSPSRRERRHRRRRNKKLVRTGAEDLRISYNYKQLLSDHLASKPNRHTRSVDWQLIEQFNETLRDSSGGVEKQKRSHKINRSVVHLIKTKQVRSLTNQHKCPNATLQYILPSTCAINQC